MKRNALPKFNNPRRRIKKPKQSKSYLSNSYSDIVRISENGPRNREERRALDKYYRRTNQGKYYQPTSQNKSRSFVSTEDILNQATVAYRKNKAKSLSTSDGLKDSIRLANERAKRASNIIKSSDTVSWKKGQTIDDILNDAWNYRQQSMWDEYQKNKAIVQAAEEDAFYEEAEAQQIEQLKKSQTSLKREITRRENLASKEEAELQELYGEYSNAADLNVAIRYAASIYGGYNDYANEILPLLKEMMRDFKGINNYKPKKGDENEYFKIDESYTGNRQELFKYITFKKIPDKYSMSIENIEELPWSSEENYQKHLEEIADQIYKSNLNQMDNIPEIDILDQLESLMKDSAAWHIASKWTEDSDQVQANWMALFDAGSLALRTDSSIFDKFRQMIRNEVDISVILSEIDTLVYDALKE